MLDYEIQKNTIIVELTKAQASYILDILGNQPMEVDDGNLYLDFLKMCKEFLE